MVRKRTRKYDSDENDTDSDLDFDFNASSHQPAPKKYSLRERKRAPMFTTDYDYYGLDEDEELRKASSDDEDFEVEADVDATSRSYYESDSGPQNSEGLIDFEDIIRADIVVNKNKIDYDNIIQKTEIKLTQPKRRGRKPKNYVEPGLEKPPEAPVAVLENDLQTLANLENQDKEEINEILQPEIKFCEGQPGEVLNGDCVENGNCNKTANAADPLALRNANNDEKAAKKPPLQDSIIKEVEEDDDDDVIVLGELKQDVIVLDD